MKSNRIILWTLRWVTVSALVTLFVSSCTTTEARPAPAQTQATRVIKTYPSAVSPPVSSPYLFYWELGPAPSYAGAVANAQGVANGTQAQEQLKQGRLPIQWVYGPQWPYGKDKADVVKYYMDSIKPYRAQMIDEWQSPKIGAPIGNPLSALNPFGIEGAIDGIAAAKARAPGSLVLIAWRGENSLLPLVKKGGVDYILVEGYSNLPKTYPQSWAIDMAGVDARIAKARSWGMITHTIPWLGEIIANDQYPAGHVLTAKDLERQIEHYRKVAPEMPGVAFYNDTNPALARAADRLCWEYYVKPAPTVSIVAPTPGESLPRSRVTIVAYAKGRHARTIREYLGFIDNHLVYKGTANHFSWNFSNEKPGEHIVTVQAIDSAWNRGVKQVTVNVR